MTSVFIRIGHVLLLMSDDLVFKLENHYELHKWCLIVATLTCLWFIVIY